MMIKWVYLGIALALVAVAVVTGQWSWLASAGVVGLLTGLRFANDRRRAREARSREH